MLKNLIEKNPNLEILHVDDQQFKRYGRVVKNLDVEEIIKVGKSLEMLKEGTKYFASLDAFEKLDIAKDIKTKYFGQTACQIGYVYGHNNLLNALEWHSCNEVNIAVTDVILILAKRCELDDDFKMDSKDCKIFYVPEGYALEVYSDTLHYCPLEASKDGFGMVVCLTEGTNTPLDFETDDKMLTDKNKWLLSHVDCKELLDKGFVAGITGINTEVKC